jgi:hypothetical protein
MRLPSHGVAFEEMSDFDKHHMRILRWTYIPFPFDEDIALRSVVAVLIF